MSPTRLSTSAAAIPGAAMINRTSSGSAEPLVRYPWTAISAMAIVTDSSSRRSMPSRSSAEAPAAHATTMVSSSSSSTGCSLPDSVDGVVDVRERHCSGVRPDVPVPAGRRTQATASEAPAAGWAAPSSPASNPVDSGTTCGRISRKISTAPPRKISPEVKNATV